MKATVIFSAGIAKVVAASESTASLVTSGYMGQGWRHEYGCQARG